MKGMIYYPGFEVKDETWLKFALLYLDRIRPIIPYTIAPKEQYISETFLRIMGETDLVRPYKPDFNEGMCASELACTEFEKYLQHPERYARFFGQPHANRLIEKWKLPQYQDCTLFEGKYSYEFFRFCIENQIASPCTEGIKISNELAYVYMSFLADVISRNNEMEMITDEQRYTQMLLKNPQFALSSRKAYAHTVKNELTLALPDNLSNIPIQEIINLRKDKEFNSARTEYVKHISKMVDCKEGRRPYRKLEDILRCEKEYLQICCSVFCMIASATLTAISVGAAIENGQPIDWISVAASTYLDAKGMNDGFWGMREFVDELKSKRLARKYIAKLGTLNSTYL